MSYRQGVYLIIKKSNLYLLAQSYSNLKEEFYFPGGGIDDGESPLDAFYRESYEELGLKKEDFTSVVNTHIVHQHSWPKKLQETKGFLGQQKTIIIGVLHASSVIDTSITNELSAVKWVSKDNLIENLPFEDLKKDIKKMWDLL